VPALKAKLGFNDSALHWDFVNTEKKRVTAKLACGSRMTVYETVSLALLTSPGVKRLLSLDHSSGCQNPIPYPRWTG
jgi:hypothetical protein